MFIIYSILIPGKLLCGQLSGVRIYAASRNKDRFRYIMETVNTLKVLNEKKKLNCVAYTY